MTIRQAPQGYESKRPKAVCDRCGFIFRHAELRKEWTSLLVCSECHDPRPPELDPPRIWPEGLPIKNPRPEQPDIELEDGDVTPESY
jgi:hypothetical protein